MRHRFLPLALALSISMSSLPLSAIAGPGDVNSVNDGQIVQDGTYYNTPGSNTTFTNSGNSGLWVQSGTTVRGLESDVLGNPTGNGGWLHFSAPGQVVRLDGNVDVSALMGNSGYLGNGGRVTIDSAFLYQNGSIFANGRNGGMVQFNTGSSVFGPNALIQARGYDGNGGVVSINSPGVVDIQRGAVIDTTGGVVGTYDRNVINIEGGLINMEGVLRADGLGSNGGTIRLVATGNSNTNCVDCVLTKSTDSSLSVVTLNQTGSTYDNAAVQLEASNTIFTAADKTQLMDRQNLLASTQDGDIVVGAHSTTPDEGLISASGSNGIAKSPDGFDGGSIFLAAVDDIHNKGNIVANGGNGLDGDALNAPGNGGNGGSITLLAGDDIINDCLIAANGGLGGHNLGHDAELNSNNGTARDIIDKPQSTRDVIEEFIVGGFSFSGSLSTNFGNASINKSGTTSRTYTFNDTSLGSQTYNIPGYGDVTFDLPEITVKVSNNDNLEAQVYIYEGNSTSGTLLYTDTFTLPNTNGSSNSLTDSFNFQAQLKDTSGNPLLDVGGNPVFLTLSRDFEISANREGNSANFKSAKFDLLTSGSGDGTKITFVTTETIPAVKHSESDTIADASAFTGGNGGNGGLIAFSYGGTMTNNNLVQANGGTGGKGGSAHARDFDFTDAYGASFAEATATGGAGGTGGRGGLVVFNGDANPDGAGTVEAKGGNGGLGGDAKAEAAAAALYLPSLSGSAWRGYNYNATANATANGGQGGEGGEGGVVVLPNPIVPGSVTYLTDGGDGGNNGIADAQAVAIAIRDADATAVSNGGASSTNEAIGITVEYNVGGPSIISDPNPVYDAMKDGGGHFDFSLTSAELASAITDNSGLGAGNLATAEVTDDTDTDTALPGGWSGAANAEGVLVDNMTGPDGADGTLDQLEAAELLVHGRNAILLENGSGSSLLSSQVFGAEVRTVDDPLGTTTTLASINTGALRNGAYGSISSTDLVLNTDFGLNLNTLTVLNEGNVINDTDWRVGRNNSIGGGHIALISTQNSILNLGNLITRGDWTGGSINLFGGSTDLIGGVANLGLIATEGHPNNRADHGGSIIIKSNSSILNLGLLGPGPGRIAADGNVNGGSIYLEAPIAIINAGVIRARANDRLRVPKVRTLPSSAYTEVLTPFGTYYNPHGFGGHIYSKAGFLNLNLGRYNANANVRPGSTVGYGGYILHHGGVISANVDLGLIFGGFPSGNGVLTASGNDFGGRIALTAGDFDNHTNDSLTVLERIFGTGGTIFGFPVGDPLILPFGTSSIDSLAFNTGFDLNLAESAYNWGHMNTFGGTQDGIMFLAGNNQIVIGDGATFNGVAYNDPQPNGGQLFLLAGQDINGHSAVWQALCAAAAALPVGGGPTPPTTTTTATDNDPNLLGLFQEQRFLLDDNIPEPQFKVMFALQDPTLFLATNYLPVTEEILALALNEYNRQLSLGNTVEEARRHVALYLEESGVTPEVAGILMEHAAQGALEVSKPVLATLEEIRNAEPTDGAGEELIQ